MSLTKYEFTKDWNNPTDFPTTESSEINVRRDMQILHDETKDAVHALIDELASTTVGESGASNIGLSSSAGLAATNVQAAINAHNTSIAALNVDKHTHANKALLDTYTQSEGDLASAVEQKHSHSNKSLLDTYTQTEAALADAVSKKHTHSNKALLDTYTQTDSSLADAVTKKHTHSNKALLDTYNQTNANIEDAVLKRHLHTNISALNSVPVNGVVQTLGNDHTTIPTSLAVANALGAAGYGDMTKAAYDTTNTGNKVDTALNAEKFGGQLPSYYAKASDIPAGGGDMTKAAYATQSNTKVDTALNAEALDSHPVSYFAKASDLPNMANYMQKASYDSTLTGNKVDTARNAEKLNGQSAGFYMAVSDYDTGGTGSKVDTAKNAEKLEGHAASYFATASALSGKQDALTASTDITVKTMTGGISYATNAPITGNADGLKFCVLTSEPSSKQAGWLYIITE